LIAKLFGPGIALVDNGVNKVEQIIQQMTRRFTELEWHGD
jgi:hypothetical protein